MKSFDPFKETWNRDDNKITSVTRRHNNLMYYHGFFFNAVIRYMNRFDIKVFVLFDAR